MSQAIEVEDRYFLSRGFNADVRINLQHFLWYDRSSSLLPTNIPLNTEGLRVADIGSGTCIWLIELARQLPLSTRLDGLDVSHQQAPPPECLPVNVHLRIHDCLKMPPPDLFEVYDIIHIQNFNSVIRDNDPGPFIDHMRKMLKPGGHLTWGEYDFQTWKTKNETPSADYDNALDRLREYTATMGGTLAKPNFQKDPWTANLPQTFEKHQLQNVLVERRPFAPEVTTFLLDTFMVASYEISVNVLDSLGGDKGKIARGYVEKVEEERRKICLELDRLTVTAQKPDQ